MKHDEQPIPVSLQVVALEKELEKARRFHKEELDKRAKAEAANYVLIHELGRRQQLIRKADSPMQGVWCWQNDGTDHLESITCPILIEAKDLSGLISDLNQQPDVQEILEWIRKALDSLRFANLPDANIAVMRKQAEDILGRARIFKVRKNNDKESL